LFKLLDIEPRDIYLLKTSPAGFFYLLWRIIEYNKQNYRILKTLRQCSIYKLLPSNIFCFCNRGGDVLINNRRGIASGDVIFIAILLFLFVTGGFLVRNVVLNLQSPNMAKFDLNSEFQNLEQTILDTFALLTGKSPANQTTSPVIPDPVKKIEVTSIRFFEADKNAPAVKDRNYKTSFPRSSKIIYTEIGYKNNRHKIMDA